jgi:hypothetical protein
MLVVRYGMVVVNIWRRKSRGLLHYNIKLFKMTQGTWPFTLTNKQLVAQYIGKLISKNRRSQASKVLDFYTKILLEKPAT